MEAESNQSRYSIFLYLFAFGNIAYALSRYVFFGRLMDPRDAFNAIWKFRILADSLGLIHALDTVASFTVHSAAVPLLIISAYGFLARRKILGFWMANLYCLLCIVQCVISVIRDYENGTIVNHVIFVTYPLMLLIVLNLIIPEEFDRKTCSETT